MVQVVTGVGNLIRLDLNIEPRRGWTYQYAFLGFLDRVPDACLLRSIAVLFKSSSERFPLR